MRGVPHLLWYIIFHKGSFCSASSMSLLPPSPPPSSHSSSYTGEWEYDVFLCFRGDDTRFGFTSHLMKALSDKQIKTFIDNKLEKTESIDELISILQRSALSVVVFSEKFADSIWCLEEVVTIARRMVEFGHRVLPVFWKVDPSDVTDDSGNYANTIDREYNGRSTYSEDKKRWMDALKAVANCAGHTSQDTKIESELIEGIVEDVQKRLIDMSPSIKSANLVGMSSRILEVERLLAMDTLDDTRIIGLWGMGGVGKTTLVEACYKRIISSNKGIKYCFIGSIAEKCGKWHGVEAIVNELPQLVNLMVLDLSYCKNLIAIPNISCSSNLEELLLYECESLVEVPYHVQYFTKLITLDLSFCKNLKRLPPKLDSKLLKHVDMSNCLKVMHCPEINSKELEELDLCKTSLVELPNAIYNVKKDGVLSLYGKNITKFPAVTTSLKRYELGHTSIREMDLHDYHHHHQDSSELVLPRFGELNLYENSQLKSLPESLWNMVSDGLAIYGSPLIESLPEISESVNGLTSLRINNCGNLKSLPSRIQELQRLTSIDLSDCRSLLSIPNSILELPNLSNLYILGCVSIRYLPELPPNLKELDVSGCKSLQALPSNTGKLLHLVFLKFDDCPQLDQNLPAELVADFLAHASLVSSFRQCNILCSRSELPDWFTYKSEDCIVKVELPLLKHSHQPMLKGIAFGVVFFQQPGYIHRHMGCKCEVGTTTVESWSFDIWVQDVNERLSEKLWLAFDNLLGNSHCKGEGDEAWYVKYAGHAVSFKFWLPKRMKIKACGVSLLY